MPEPTTRPLIQPDVEDLPKFLEKYGDPSWPPQPQQTVIEQAARILFERSVNGSWEKEPNVFRDSYRKDARALAAAGLLADPAALNALNAALTDASNVAVSAIRLMNQAGAERDALQARIDAAIKLCDRGFVSPYATTGFLQDLRASLRGDATHPQTSTEES